MTKVEISRRKERAKKKRRRDPRWQKLLVDYYDLCDAKGRKINRDLVAKLSVDALAILVEVLREERNKT